MSERQLAKMTPEEIYGEDFCQECGDPNHYTCDHYKVANREKELALSETF